MSLKMISHRADAHFHHRFASLTHFLGHAAGFLQLISACGQRKVYDQEFENNERAT